MSHISNTLTKCEQILLIAETRIEDSLVPGGKRLGITKLSEDIARELNYHWALTYQIISLYMDERADLKIKHGKNGGVIPAVADLGVIKV